MHVAEDGVCKFIYCFHFVLKVVFKLSLILI